VIFIVVFAYSTLNNVDAKESRQVLIDMVYLFVLIINN
jgi:hypothetical protein